MATGSEAEILQGRMWPDYVGVITVATIPRLPLSAAGVKALGLDQLESTRATGRRRSRVRRRRVFARRLRSGQSTR